MASTTYLSAVVYTDNLGDLTGITDLTFVFPYLDVSHINVYRDGVGAVRNVDWTMPDASTVRLVTPVGVDETITIRRITKKDTRLVDFANGSTLTENDLNTVTKQLLYLIQELNDQTTAVNDPNGDGTGLPGGGATNPDYIDTLVDLILSRQIFLDLITLIDLVDVNAEEIIGEIVANHNDWTLLREREFLYEQLDGLVDAQGVSIVSLQTITSDGTFASALQLDALAATVGLNQGLIATLQQVQADDHSAFASRLDLIEADVGTANASITTLQSAMATEQAATATFTTEIAARLRTADLDTELALSSYIQGIEATVSLDGADIDGIQSYLVGVGDYANPAVNSLGWSVSGLQTTVNAHASSISAEATWRQAMASAFGVPVGDGAALASSITTEWETYADAAVAGSTVISTLQANTKPIFFNANPPSPLDPTYNNGNPDWASSGFPTGSTWFRQKYSTSGTHRWQVEQFYYNRTAPSSILSELSGLGYYLYNRTSDNASIGGWFPAIDQHSVDMAEANEADIYWLDQDIIAAGARIDTVEDVLVGPAGSIASWSTRLQAVYGSSITNVEEQLDAYIKPGEGIVYSGWNVRMNTYINGTPVIAGVGLGIQSDPHNPDAGASSDFIVMADRFSVIRPPAFDDLTGGLVSSTIKIPFIIDADTGLVAVNGDLIVRGTLKAYTGGLYDVSAGRFQAGQMNTDIELSSPTGIRVGMYSSTNGYWNSSAASPFGGGSNPQKFLIWGGSGTMNHNNAIFYIDTDGNAYFDGEVSAENINGDLSTAVAISKSFSEVTATSTASYTYIGTTFTADNTASRGKVPTAIVNVTMYGSSVNAGGCSMQMRLETSPGSGSYGSWQTVAEASTSMGYSATQTLIGSLATSHLGKVQVRIGLKGLSGVPGLYPKCSTYNGVFLFIS